MSRPQIILTTGPLGGLGDHLLYSSLPERYTALGFDVYLDQDNVTRNSETFDLIWGRNPYIVGTSDKKPNAGYIHQGKFYDVAGRFPIGSIESMERAHGFLPPYSLAPKIYYQPQPFRINLEQMVLVDLAAISSKISTEGINELLPRMANRFINKQFLMVTFPNGIISSVPPIEGPSVQMNSIYEYVDALASCYGWVGSEAGGQALAAAVRGEYDVHDMERRPEIVSVISPKTFNSRGYTFRGVDYRVTVHGNVSTDYWDPVEVSYERYALMCRLTVEEARAAFAASKSEQ